MTLTNLSGKAQTVLGHIEPEELGITTTHEHLLLDFRCVFQMPEDASGKGLAYAPITLENLGWVRYHWNGNLDNLTLFDEETAIAEASLFARAGGRTVVDATNIGIARDPRALVRISHATGLNIIMGSGYYVASTHPSDLDQRTEEDIAQEIVQDITEGVGDTGVKAGIIGEIGCSSPLTENERKVLRASAVAQRRTGAPLLIHPGRHERAPIEVMGILGEAGADPKRAIMSHIERTIYDGKALMALAATGCYLEYDLFGHESSYYPLSTRDMPSDAQRMDQIGRLIAEGFVDRVLLAHDVCSKHRLKCYGGHGFDHILENIVPRMRKRGVTEEQLHTMLVENPRRVLTFV